MEDPRAAVRLMGDLGRIVIPAEIREALGWGTGKELEIAMNDAERSVIIREVSHCCSLCREESEGLVNVGKGYICTQCAGKIRRGRPA